MKNEQVKTIEVNTLMDVFPEYIGNHKRILLSETIIGDNSILSVKGTDIDYENLQDLVLYLNTDFHFKSVNQIKGIHVIVENGKVCFNVANFDLDLLSNKDIQTMEDFDKLDGNWGYNGIGEATSFENTEIGFLKSVSKLFQIIDETPKLKDFSIKEEIKVVLEDLGLDRELNSCEILDLVEDDDDMLGAITVAIYKVIQEKLPEDRIEQEDIKNIINNRIPEPRGFISLNRHR